MKHKIVLRGDGNNLIGFGHIYRLLALADILKHNYYLVFATYKTSEFIENEISNYCDEIIILPGELPFKTPDEITVAEEIDFDLNHILQGEEIVVLDGYYFGTKYQQAVKERNCKLVCIDDLAVHHFYADLVINHAPAIDEIIYKKESYTKLFTGLDYAILRKPYFLPFKPSYKNNNDVFISLGGSDYLQITLKIVRFLQQLSQFDTLHIMTSSSFPEEMMNELLLMRKESEHIKLYQNLTATEIVTLMDSCKYAFVSASTVLLEAYSRRLKCFTGFYTNNQKFIYNGFIKENKAIGLGNLTEIKEDIIEKSLNNFVQVENDNCAESGEQPSEKLIEIFLLLNFKLRKTRPDDIRTYYEWANDEIVRKNSINQHSIEWRDHISWFENKLTSNSSKLFVLEYLDKPVGQIRIDLNADGFWRIDFSIERTKRRLGFGKKIIQLLLVEEPHLKFKAIVKTDNLPSGKAFQNSNFKFGKYEKIGNGIYNVFEFSK